MDKADFQKYIDEMKRMSESAALPREETQRIIPEKRIEPTVNDLSGEGYIMINVTTVKELYPVENAKATIFKGRREEMLKYADGLTDESGKTELFSLPAPPRSRAQDKDTTLPVYENYNVMVESEDYLTSINYNVPVFDGVTSIQNVNLVPKTSYNQGDTTVYDDYNDYNL